MVICWASLRPASNGPPSPHWWPALGLVTRYEAGCICAARFSLQRPVLVVIGLVFLNVGLGSLLSLFFQDGPAFQDLRANRLLVVLWNGRGYQFLHNVISVVLLFWLARRRLRCQEAF